MTFTGAVISSFRNLRTIALMLFVAASLSGCGASKKALAPVFFPPPPDDPKIQYLTGVTTSADLQEAKGGLTKLVVGGAETVIKIGKPYGIAFKNGKLYVCDIGSSQVVVVDFVNKTMKNLNEDVGPGELRKPVAVAVDDEGYIYVADTGRKDLAVYRPDGKYLKSMGKGLSQTGLVGVAVHKNFLLGMDNRMGFIFVMDKKTGEVLTTIGNNADKTKNLALPNGISVDPKGNIHVVNMGNGSVKEYDLDGNMLSVFGKLGDAPGQFTRPRGISVDPDGNVFIVDAGHQVVQVFNSDKRILGFFGQPGLPAGSMNLPAGVSVTKENLDLFQKFAAPGFQISEIIFVSNQYISPFNGAISIYALGEMAGADKKEPAAQGKGEAPPGK